MTDRTKLKYLTQITKLIESIYLILLMIAMYALGSAASFWEQTHPQYQTTENEDMHAYEPPIHGKENE